MPDDVMSKAFSEHRRERQKALWRREDQAQVSIVATFLRRENWRRPTVRGGGNGPTLMIPV
jgi:hypothetical protein